MNVAFQKNHLLIRNWDKIAFKSSGRIFPFLCLNQERNFTSTNNGPSAGLPRESLRVVDAAMIEMEKRSIVSHTTFSYVQKFT